ncbi:MAG: aldehyde dehydrogenase family protein [Burkholderiaceae bacterium]|nr:aldehyde dehydrogenase family protein [Burkholderiaceae bacterium]
MKADEPFKLTYSTMFDPPAALHERFDAALLDARGLAGRELPMWIDGRERLADQSFDVRSPIDRDLVLARFPRGGAHEASDAIAAAQRAYPRWSATPWRERVQLLRRAAALIEERVYLISAAAHAQAHVVDRDETAKLLDQALRLENEFAAHRAPSPGSGCATFH